MERGRRYWPAGLAIALVVFLADQAVKQWILTGVFGFAGVIDPTDWHPPIEVTGFFNLVMVWNFGVSFGLFSEHGDAARWFLIAVAAAISTGIGIWMVRTDRMLIAAICGAVIGGAVGNVVDRLRFGAVADFFDVHAFGYHWPAFNIADAAISVGVVVLVLDSLFERRDDRAAGSADKR
ncbi:MAG: signal peptidase II [Deinococcus-Thermus bacterium]|jgi:signal peptidase II|nr:signal peptidase II [Deinococcota bacterium]